MWDFILLLCVSIMTVGLIVQQVIIRSLENYIDHLEGYKWRAMRGEE